MPSIPAWDAATHLDQLEEETWRQTCEKERFVEVPHKLGVVMLVAQSLWCAHFEVGGSYLFLPLNGTKRWTLSHTFLSPALHNTSQLPNFSSGYLKDIPGVCAASTLTCKVLAHPEQRTFHDIAQMCQAEGPAEDLSWNKWHMRKSKICVQLSRHEWSDRLFLFELTWGPNFGCWDDGTSPFDANSQLP